MKKLTLILLAVTAFVSSSCTKTFQLSKDKSASTAIVIPANPTSIHSFSAQELKKHLDLLLGESINIVSQPEMDKYEKHFLIGIKPDGFTAQLKPEEAVYVIDKKEIYIFGFDEINRQSSSDNPGELKNAVLNEVLNLEYNRTGTLFAVYNFLENELGFRWIKPGDNGIFYEPKTSVSVPLKTVQWAPPLVQRNIRMGSMSYNGQLRSSKYAPKEFVPEEDKALKKQQDLMIWMRRMRMGRNQNYRFGHAYTTYWEKYKDSNPEIFALTAKGNRKPMGRLERVKLCPSNPELPGIIVNEWKNSGDTLSRSISGCENDSDGHGEAEWCHCERCNALDARKEGEKLNDYATDRYIFLWNAVLDEARKVQKDILVSGYAYENMLQPPRKEKLRDGILIEFIPRMGGDFEKTQHLYEGWRQAGMKIMMFRPNDMNWEIGIPMGQEERIFEHFKLAIANNAIGTDFDSMLGFWEGISDITYYILSKGHFNTESTFTQLEDEYLTVFGEAKDDVASYYRHWRNIFNNKILPEELKLNDGVNTHFLEWHRLWRLTARIDEFYSIEDFDKTDAYLENALKKDLSDQSRNYIKRMQIANRNSRLTFLSLLAGKNGNKDEIISRGKELMEFRIQNRDKVDINWNTLFQQQHYQMNDQIGTKYLGFLPEDLSSRDL